MKATRMTIQQFSPPAVILMATVVAIITSIVVANATQTIQTPNAGSEERRVGKESNCGLTPLDIKQTEQDICCCTNYHSVSVGPVMLIHLPGGGMSSTDVK